MKLTDRRLYQASNLQDFRFRLGFEENSREHNALEHFDVLYKGAAFEAKVTAVLVMPDPLRTWGTDHSRWDGNVNFEPMRAMGARFTFIKAMEGTVPTTYYIENTLRAKDEGLAVAPYHWLHANNRVNCKTQAQKFWERVSPYVGLPAAPNLSAGSAQVDAAQVGKLPPMIDFEWTYWSGIPAYPNYTDLDIFVTEFTRISGIKPLWYSAAGYMNIFGRMPTALRAKFAGFVVANYGVLFPNMPIGFAQDDWDFWQFAATGDAEKISPNDAGKKEVDLLYSKLTHAAFDTRYGTGGVMPEPPTGEPMQYKFTVLTNERTSANATITTNLTGRVYAVGDVVDVVQVVPVSGNQWFKLSNGKYAAYIYNGVTRAVLVDSDPVPAPGLPVFNIEVKVTGEGYKPKVVIVDMEPE